MLYNLNGLDIAIAVGSCRVDFGSVFGGGVCRSNLVLISGEAASEASSRSLLHEAPAAALVHHDDDLLVLERCGAGGVGVRERLVEQGALLARGARHGDDGDGGEERRAEQARQDRAVARAEVREEEGRHRPRFVLLGISAAPSAMEPVVWAVGRGSSRPRAAARRTKRRVERGEGVGVSPHTGSSGVDLLAMGEVQWTEGDQCAVSSEQ